MDVTTTKANKRARKAYVPKRTYDSPGIPYQISRPNAFWRIKKNLPPADYWKKRYWRRRITGRGDYRMDKTQNFGTRWGGYIGSKVGEWAGGGLQSLVGKITGVGDYQVRSNIFASGRLPEVVNPAGAGGNVIRFQEYLADIITSDVAGAFKIDSYNINAGNIDTFPFLSQIACNYEQYEIQGMLFEFKSTSGDALNSVNTALGSVMMATQYDVLDKPFTSKSEMLNYEFSSSCKPSDTAIHMIECDPRQTTINELYVLYNQGYPANSDKRLYDLGKFSIATTGFQGTSVNIGQLAVTYQVKLLKPKLFTSLGSTSDYSVYKLEEANVYSETKPIGLITVKPNDQNFDLTVRGADVNWLVFPTTSTPAFYRIEVIWRASLAGSGPLQTPSLAFVNAQLLSLSNINEAANENNLGLFIGVKTLGNSKFTYIQFNTDGVLPNTSTNGELIIRVMQVTPELSAQ